MAGLCLEVVMQQYVPVVAVPCDAGKKQHHVAHTVARFAGAHCHGVGQVHSFASFADADPLDSLQVRNLARISVN